VFLLGGGPSVDGSPRSFFRANIYGEGGFLFSGACLRLLGIPIAGANPCKLKHAPLEIDR
jgi:hypothetical protein